MAAKTLFVLCSQALLLQMTLAQAIFPNSGYYSDNSIVDNTIVIGGSPSYGINYGSGLGNFGSGGLTSGLVGSGLTTGISSGLVSSGFGSSGVATIGNVVSGGPLLVTAISPIGPSGLAVASENIIEGILTVSGQLPYLSAVAFEGALPTAGAGAATCGCGNGEVGIVSVGLNNGGRMLY